VYQVKSSGYELVGTYECMTAANLPFFIFHRGGVLFFVIDVMVTVVFEVSGTSCVVVGTFRPAVCCNTLAIQHTGLGSLDVRNPLLEVAAVKSSGPIFFATPFPDTTKSLIEIRFLTSASCLRFLGPPQSPMIPHLCQ